MADILNGKLVISNGQKRVCYPTKKSPMSQPTPFDSTELAPELAGASVPEEGLAVELELEGGKPVRIRPVGQPWKGRSAAGTRVVGGGASGGGAGQPSGQGNRPARAAVTRQFHNPYNFVPAPPRNTTDSELGDAPPAGHDAYLPGRWTGRIRVRLLTATPVLAVDASLVRMDGDHGVYPVRLGPDGQPYLAPTSIKGMLRSAYEAVTNSRMGVFESHEDRLAYRAAARTTTRPARVERNGQGLALRPLNVARLPRYEKLSRAPDHGERQNALQYAGVGGVPQNGDHVYVRTQKHGVDVVVEEIRPWTSSPPGPGFQEGWVYITGPNIRGKRCERVFVVGSGKRVPATEEHRKLWKELVGNYREIHKEDLEKRRENNRRPEEYLGDKPGETAWSRHIYDSSMRELVEGTLCYMEEKNNQVVGLYPVSISRRLFPKAPAELIPDDLKPASNRESLSPADRVFGWVNTRAGGKGAYRGCLRIGQARLSLPTEGGAAVTEFRDPGIPLAILGQPRPQQSRFYAAVSQKGEAQADGLSKEEAGYVDGRGLRGRKVYPHHDVLPAGYWAFPPQGGGAREFIRPGSGGEARDNQNRSILGWVRPGVSFTTDIHVTNLSGVELGALIWLLSLPEGHYHRLGGGKPLGFGSVRLEIDWEKSDLRRGEEWKLFYRSLDGEPAPGAEEVRAATEEFRKAVAAAYGNGSSFEQTSFIAAFLKSAKGFGDGRPVHYPRVTPQPQTVGENFKWFVANESDRQGVNRKLALGDLVDDPGLPLYEGEADGGGRERGGGRDRGGRDRGGRDPGGRGTGGGYRR